ncbi:hypothetical protein V6N13_089373 [Hibiscus sabdariffa]|uniref:Uncharacterized protein n=1 Tax=Hibiscus sabdariffa TaxID=183260 RepID=A0ABR2NST1_9ROSI
MDCCGSKWGFRSTTMSLRDEDEVENEIQEPEQDPVHNPDLGCVNPTPVSLGMNLAAALATERHCGHRTNRKGRQLVTPISTATTKQKRNTMVAKITMVSTWRIRRVPSKSRVRFIVWIIWASMKMKGKLIIMGSCLGNFVD